MRGFVRVSLYPKLFQIFTHFHTRQSILPARELSSIRRHVLQPSVTDRGCTSYGSKVQLANTLGLLVHILLHATAWWTAESVR